MKWSVADKHPQRAVLHIVDQTGYPIACVYTAPEDLESMDESTGIWQNDPQRQFNARLLAAAPDLLAALMAAKDMIQANKLDVPNTMGQINAAIEKAIGGVV